jgi:hypothetical protein
VSGEDLRAEPRSTLELIARAAREGEIALPSFSAFELMAVAAGSPVRGLVADSDFLSMDDDSLLAEIEAAAASLVERKRVMVGDDASRPFEMAWDLAAIVNMRRRPAAVGVVSLAAVDPAPNFEPATHILAVAHGVALEKTRLAAFLEETLVRAPLHDFYLCTAERLAERILKAYLGLVHVFDGRLTCYTDVYILGGQRRTRLALAASGDKNARKVMAYSSSGERDWREATVIDDAGGRWTELFMESLVPTAVRAM